MLKASKEANISCMRVPTVVPLNRVSVAAVHVLESLRRSIPWRFTAPGVSPAVAPTSPRMDKATIRAHMLIFVMSGVGGGTLTESPLCRLPHHALP